VLAGCELILHCGDLHTIEVVDRLERIAPTVVSRGNGDTRTPRVRRPGVADDPRVADVFVREVGGVRIGLVHDLEHLEHRTDDDVAAGLARCFGERVDLAVSGHTHVPMVRGLADGTVLVNPGSPTMPYGYLGLVGTIGLLDVTDDGFTIEVVDLATGEPQLRVTGPGAHPTEVGPRPVGGH
jgi:putative phosphoesterase